VYASDEILDEVRGSFTEIGSKAPVSPQSVLDWYCDHVKLVKPAPLGKQRSRDTKDDPYLACALAAEAKIVVTRATTYLRWASLLASKSLLLASFCSN
jgi:predicted nucleic acid-binding protein